jgi:hypothetical protein
VAGSQKLNVLGAKCLPMRSFRRLNILPLVSRCFRKVEIFSLPAICRGPGRNGHHLHDIIVTTLAKTFQAMVML